MDRVTASFYDAFNNLVGRTLTQNTYDGDSLSGTTVTSAHFIYDGDNLVLELGDSGGVEARVLDGPAVDQVLAQEDGAGTVTWALGDNQGTIRDLVTYAPGTGNTSVVDHLTYSAFGAPLSGLAADFLFGYTGRFYDQATGLQWNLNRWYDPSVGKWLSEDPSGLAADANPYRYCDNGPTDGTDPTGFDVGVNLDGSYTFGSNGGDGSKTVDPNGQVHYNYPQQREVAPDNLGADIFDAAVGKVTDILTSTMDATLQAILPDITHPEFERKLFGGEVEVPLSGGWSAMANWDIKLKVYFIEGTAGCDLVLSPSLTGRLAFKLGSKIGEVGQSPSNPEVPVKKTNPNVSERRKRDVQGYQDELKKYAKKLEHARKKDATSNPEKVKFESASKYHGWDVKLGFGAYAKETAGIWIFAVEAEQKLLGYELKWSHSGFEHQMTNPSYSVSYSRNVAGATFEIGGYGTLSTTVSDKDIQQLGTALLSH